MKMLLKKYSDQIHTLSFCLGMMMAFALCLGCSSRPELTAGDMLPLRFELLGADHTPLPMYVYEGRRYVKGKANQKYKIKVHNPMKERVEAVVSVDERDVINGKMSDPSYRGYVLMPNSHLEIEGFRSSENTVAAFTFTNEENSYASRRGEGEVGIITVMFFKEKDEIDDQVDSKSADLGTAYGAQQYSASQKARFIRATEDPFMVQNLYYNHQKGLEEEGVEVEATKPNPFPEN